MYLLAHSDFIVISLLLLVLGIKLLAHATRRTEILFLSALTVLPAEGLATSILSTLSYLCPHKIDLYVCRIDSFFGYPEFYLGKFLVPRLWARLAAAISYSLLGSAMLFTFAIYLWYRSEREASMVAAAFLLNLFAAIPFYLILPACGPRYAFLNFPALPPSSFTPHFLLIAAPPNCIPSVHTSTALLVLWFLRPWRAGRIFGSIFLALTIITILGTGEHYFVDLLCAVPYAAGIVWATTASLNPSVISHAPTAAAGARNGD